MHSNSIKKVLLLSTLAVALPSLALTTEQAVKLANNSGCMACHHIEPGAKGPNGMVPIGPAWKDVSSKYRGQANAQKELTAIVMVGSNPYNSHWKDKVSGFAMPPNQVAISEDNAGKLVKWILSLDAGK